jgi:small subunit ribosomal protein S20
LPNIESSIRQLRTDAKRTSRNKSVRTQCKTDITKAEKLISAGKRDEAQAAVTTAVSALNKAAAKGVLHPNNASRRQARLMKKLNSVKS